MECKMILKNLYYEVIVEPFVRSFISYLYDEGYREESNAMINAMGSWSSKALQRIKAEKYYKRKH